MTSVDGQADSAADVAGEDALVGPGDDALDGGNGLVADDEIGAEIGTDDEKGIGTVNRPTGGEPVSENRGGPAHERL